MFRRSLLVCIGLMLFCSHAVASERVQHKPSFTVADVEPWGYEDPDGQPGGLVVDFIRRLSELTGIDFAIRLRPHTRAILELEEGKADLAVLFATPKSESIGISLGNVVAMRVLLVGLASRQPVDSLDALAGRQVGYIRGTFYGPGFNKHPGIERLAVKNMAQGLDLLDRGRIDAMVGTDRALVAGLKESRIDPSKIRVIYELPPTRGDIYLSRESQRTELAEPISRAVEAMEEAGTLEVIFRVPGYEVIEPLLD